MTWEKFWSIIDRVRAQADMQDEASVKQFLYTELIKLPQDELLGFDCAWQSYRNKANFPKMVAAACIINDGSSDDRFTDFRNWLIMQGYDAYRQALIDPDNLAALNIPFRDTEWMGCGNVAWYAYAGQQLHTYFEKEEIAAKLFRKYPTLLKLPDDLNQAIMREQLAPHHAQETEWERQMLRTEVKHYIDTSGLAYSYVSGINRPIYPIAFIKYKTAIGISAAVCCFSPTGRKKIHDNLEMDTTLFAYLRENPPQGHSLEYADCRLSLLSAQKGKCSVSGELLVLYNKS